MPQPSRSRQPAKPEYTITGLDQSGEQVLILFEGRTYDLKNLTAEDLAYLTQFPDQVPYLTLPQA